MNQSADRLHVTNASFHEIGTYVCSLEIVFNVTYVLFQLFYANLKQNLVALYFSRR